MEPCRLVIRVHAPEKSGEADQIFLFEDLLDITRMRNLELAIMSTTPIATISAELMPESDYQKAVKLGSDAA